MTWYYTEKIYNPVNQCLGRQLVILLPGAGCAWAKKSGGCYMCGFNRSNYRYSGGRLLPACIFRGMLRLALARTSAEILAIYNGGSFLNPEEIPIAIPGWLSERVAKHPHVRQLFMESRPEFVTPERIQMMVEALGGKELKVGIGLECVTDIIREKCVNKGFSLSEYEKAVNTVKVCGAHVLTYVFLKPLFLSESEAIEEAVKTISYAFATGADEVALESAFVQEGTLMHELFLRGEYKPPWLWSIIEVVKRTQNMGPVYVGGFNDEPPPIAIPSNCSECSHKVEETLQLFREMHNVSFLGALRCGCLREWKRELWESVPPLGERIRVLPARAGGG